MNGVHNALLSGFVIPASFNPKVDHTYVTSSCGRTWGCWGRKAGGSLIVSGGGSSYVAGCLSLEHERAGIAYGLTGVCHQAANRILFPAAVLVDGARGYAASVMAYGHYGIGLWSQRARCVEAAMERPLKMGLDQSTWTGPASGAVVNDSQELTFLESGIAKDFKDLIDSRLGGRLSPMEYASILDIQERIFDARRASAKKLLTGSVSHDCARDEIQMYIYRGLAESLLLLGKDRFETLFGEDAYDQARIIDRDAFKDHYLISSTARS